MPVLLRHSLLSSLAAPSSRSSELMNITPNITSREESKTNPMPMLEEVLWWPLRRPLKGRCRPWDQSLMDPRASVWPGDKGGCVGSLGGCRASLPLLQGCCYLFHSCSLCLADPPCLHSSNLSPHPRGPPAAVFVPTKALATTP